MKIKTTTLAERQLYKLEQNLTAKRKIFSSKVPLDKLISNEPVLFIKEQNFNRTLNPEIARKAFFDSGAVEALKAVRSSFGRISVTKAVQKFFESPRGQLMRLMQDMLLGSLDEKDSFKELNRAIKAERRKYVPKKIQKTWS